MGLSDEERLEKIWWGVTQLQERLRDLPADSEEHHTLIDQGVHLLREKVDQTWNAFLGRGSNSTFWLLGGDASDEVRGPHGAWSTAICGLCEEARRENPEDSPQEDFNAFDQHLSVEALLGDQRGRRRIVYDVFCWTEQLIYALRRYDDNLRQTLDPLSKLLADMQGICFGIFARDEDYAKAYVLNRVLAGLLGGEYLWQKDKLGKILLDDMNLADRFTRAMVANSPPRGESLKTIIAWDHERLSMKPTVENRLLLLMRIAGRRLHYEHQIKDLLGHLKKARLRVRPEHVLYEFAKCKAAHDEKEGGDQAAYNQRSEEEALYAIHGSAAFDLVKDRNKRNKKGKKSC